MATYIDIGAFQKDGMDIGAFQRESGVTPPTGMMTTNTGYWGALVTLFGLLLLGGFY